MREQCHRLRAVTADGRNACPKVFVVTRGIVVTLFARWHFDKVSRPRLGEHPERWNVVFGRGRCATKITLAHHFSLAAPLTPAANAFLSPGQESSESGSSCFSSCIQNSLQLKKPIIETLSPPIERVNAPSMRLFQYDQTNHPSLELCFRFQRKHRIPNPSIGRRFLFLQLQRLDPSSCPRWQPVLQTHESCGYGRIHGGSNELGSLFVVGAGSSKASDHAPVHFHRLRCLLNRKMNQTMGCNGQAPEKKG